MSGDRRPQLAYSEIQDATRNDVKRRAKADKIVRVIRHFLGRSELDGLLAVDVGSSTGFTGAALREAGATVVGSDIDQPGLRFARHRFGDRLALVQADGEALPFPAGSVDVVVFNHIYEHVVDADAVMGEIRRILRPDGMVYLGLGNKRILVEPHYRLPFLSWLPPTLADRYILATGRADSYYERFRTRPALVEMSAGLRVWDYTTTILGDPELFAATDMVSGPLGRLPAPLWRAAMPVLPTFIWVGTPGDRHPSGPSTRIPPTRIPPTRISQDRISH